MTDPIVTDALTAVHADWWDMAPDQSVCDGCDRCGARCVDGWECTRGEFEALLAQLERSPEALSVLAQPKEEPWGDDHVVLCWFRDRQRHRCAVYPARPFICRLFGHVEWLPCPAGDVVPAPGSGVAEMRSYALQPRRTFAGWSQEADLRDHAKGVLGVRLFARLAEAHLPRE